ncbi:MAG: hypothetical protein WKF66_02075 [Pedobacter sp.]
MGTIVKLNKPVEDEQIKSTLNSSFHHWTVNNDKISCMVKDVDRLITYQGNGKVDIDLSRLPDSFVNKYFVDKPKLFADEFIRKLEPSVFNSLSSLSIPDYEIEYTFRYVGIHTSRTVKYYMLTRML